MVHTGDQIFPVIFSLHENWIKLDLVVTDSTPNEPRLL